jgi:hypothetical protein
MEEGKKEGGKEKLFEMNEYSVSAINHFTGHFQPLSEAPWQHLNPVEDTAMI